MHGERRPSLNGKAELGSLSSVSRGSLGSV